MKKILKKDRSISIERIIIWELSTIIFDRSLTGKNPPDEIKEKAKFKELKDLTEKTFNTININNVRNEYSKKILLACLNISELSNDI